MTDRGGIYNSQWRAGCGTERPESGGTTAKGLLQSFDLVGFEPCLPQMTSAIEAIRTGDMSACDSTASSALRTAAA